MKTRIVHIITIASILLFGSCGDYLEVMPTQSLVQEEYWQTESDVQAVMMGAYSNFGVSTAKIFEYSEVRADLTQIYPFSEDNDKFIDLKNGNITPLSSYYSWGEFYSTINLCNYVLEYAPVVYGRDETFDEIRYKGYISEALFLRSLSYFYLVRFWNEVPLVLTSSQTDQQDFFPAKSSEEVVLTQIKADLERARLSVRDTYADADNEGNEAEIVANNKGRANLTAILSLLADIALWEEDYQGCVDYINMIDPTKVTLLPTNEWFEIFYPGNSEEGIFEVQFNQANSQPSNWVNNINTEEGTPEMLMPSYKASRLLNPSISSEFVRGYGSIYTGRMYDVIWKFSAKAATASRELRSTNELFSANFIVYRYADVLLMQAEAYTQLGELDKALELVNEIRSRANMVILPSTNSKSEMEELVLEERAVELIYESKRWFDLVRMGRRNNYEKKSQLIEYMVEGANGTTAITLRIKYKDPNSWFLPIVQTELELNKNLKQNPYYEYLSTK